MSLPLSCAVHYSYQTYRKSSFSTQKRFVWCFRMIYVCGTQNDTLINLHLYSMEKGKIIAVSTFFVCRLLSFHLQFTQVKVLLQVPAFYIHGKKVTGSINETKGKLPSRFVFYSIMYIPFPLSPATRSHHRSNIDRYLSYGRYKLYCVWCINRNQCENSS
jgi:hypothetical protein